MDRFFHLVQVKFVLVSRAKGILHALGMYKGNLHAPELYKGDLHAPHLSPPPHPPSSSPLSLWTPPST